MSTIAGTRPKIIQAALHPLAASACGATFLLYARGDFVAMLANVAWLCGR
jgi:hypothetical protein